MQVFQSSVVVAHSVITGCQGTVGTGYLVHIAETLEEQQGIFSQFQAVVVFCQRLLGIGFEVGIAIALSNVQTVVQALYFVMIYLLRGACSQYAAGTDVVKVVQVLGRIASYLVGVHVVQCCRRLLFQTDIIIIGGVDDSHFGGGIRHAPLHTLRQRLALLVDALHVCEGTFTVLVEGPVVAAALTETHVLHLGYKLLYLIVGKCEDFVQLFFRPCIIHADNADESHIVQCLSLASIIVC